MSQVVVNRLPQTAPISDMRNRQNDLLTMAEHGPVVLLSRSKPAAVLLSPELWDAIAEALGHSGITVKDTEKPILSFAAANQEQEVDAFAEIAALAQPFGPSDLSINFDKYTGRVLDDELDD